ncbi:hypothetical protein [Tissierella sp.]|uniref:hypothetical protein n=1 Tax=Tissierella sp. TaxID=41274 RepID=UPI0028A9170A|nr:hypothetical protein [Tissierella sp.]
MDNKDKKILEDHDRFMKKVLKAVLYTLSIFLLTMFGINLILGLIFQSDFSIIVSFSVGIIFIIFYCALTIIEEIRKIK